MLLSEQGIYFVPELYYGHGKMSVYRGHTDIEASPSLPTAVYPPAPIFPPQDFPPKIVSLANFMGECRVHIPGKPTLLVCESVNIAISDFAKSEAQVFAGAAASSP